MDLTEEVFLQTSKGYCSEQCGYRRVYIERDALYALRSIATVRRPFVCLSVHPSVRPSVTLMYRMAWRMC